MDKIHNLFFCTQCGQKLTGFENKCPGCSFLLSEKNPPKEETPVTAVPPVPPVVSEIKPVAPKPDAPKINNDLKNSPAVSDAAMNQPFYPEKAKKKKKKKGLGVVWLIIIIFFGVLIVGGGTVAFLQYNGNIDIALLKEYIPSKNTISETALNNLPADSLKQAEATTNERQGQDSAGLKKDPVSGSRDNSGQENQGTGSGDTGMKYFIIAGSYGNEQQAQQEVGTLKAKGYPDARLVGQSETGNWRICYKAFATHSEAAQELGSIRQKDNPSAWIFEQK